MPERCEVSRCACFILGLLCQQFIFKNLGLVLTSLLMEVNSVFVHTRLLMKYSGNTENVFFPVVKLLNLVTNIPFRYSVGKHLIERMLARPNYSRDAKWYALMTSLGIISTLNILVLARVFHQGKVDKTRFLLVFDFKTLFCLTKKNRRNSSKLYCETFFIFAV